MSTITQLIIWKLYIHIGNIAKSIRPIENFLNFLTVTWLFLAHFSTCPSVRGAPPRGADLTSAAPTAQQSWISPHHSVHRRSHSQAAHTGVCQLFRPARRLPTKDQGSPLRKCLPYHSLSFIGQMATHTLVLRQKITFSEVRSVIPRTT